MKRQIWIGGIVLLGILVTVSVYFEGKYIDRQEGKNDIQEKQVVIEENQIGLKDVQIEIQDNEIQSRQDEVAYVQLEDLEKQMKAENMQTKIEDMEIKIEDMQIKTENLIGNGLAESTISVSDNTNIVEDGSCFFSEKTVISKEELYKSRSLFRYAQNKDWKEYQKYQEEKRMTADLNAEYRNGGKFLDSIAERKVPDDVISIEGYDDVRVDAIFGEWLTASFQGADQSRIREGDSLLPYGPQRGLLVYDLKNKMVLFTILPENGDDSVISSTVTENYLYWCEANPYDMNTAWAVKGMDLETQTVFIVCQSEEFPSCKMGNFPYIGSCYKDDLYFYFTYLQEITEEKADLEISSKTDTISVLELMCYQPDKCVLTKKTEFNFVYNNYKKPCLSEDFIYTVDYDGSSWYILSYHLPTDTYCRYLVDITYETESIQDIYAFSEYIVYTTSFSRRFLLNKNTLEVREFADWFPWSDIYGDKIFLRRNEWDYCYDIAEDKLYKLLETEDFGYTIIGNCETWVIFDENECNIYLYYF